MKRKNNLNRLSIAACLSNLILGLIFLAVSFFIDSFIFTATGCLAFAIMLLPICFNRNYDVLSSWSVACGSVFLGLYIRGFYVGFEYPSYETVNHFWIRNSPHETFIYPSLLLLLGLLICAFGFLLTPQRKIIPNYRYTANPLRLYGFALMALIVSLASTILYINLTGGFDFNNLSSKRTLINSLDYVNTSHRTYGFLRNLSEIALIAHLLVVVDISISKSKKKPKILLAFSLLLLALFLPFYASSRFNVVFFIAMSAATLYFCNRNINWTRIIIISICCLLLFQTMSILRSLPYKSASFTELLLQDNQSISTLDSVVLNRNMIELGKTAHIINSVPKTLDYKYGQTIAVWAVAVIPRSIWPNKPLISSGPIIGKEIYGLKVTGVPPSLIAELYWNFGILGILIGCFFVGRIFAWIDTKFKPILTFESKRSDPFKAVIFIFGPFAFGHIALGYGLGIAMFNVTLSTILVFMVVSFVCKKTPLN